MATTALCSVCETPLVTQLAADSSDDEADFGSSSAPQTVPDDVTLLACLHHFHWQCLLETCTSTACPQCQTDLTADGEHILVNIENEGGISQSQDIYRILREEAYLKQAAEERKARAFLEFCREGDVEALVGMLQEDDSDDMEDDEDMMDEDEEPMPHMPVDLVLQYQDPINEGMSGLHTAVLGGSQEVAWLLLWIASALPEQAFPSDLRAQAEALELPRGMSPADIREIKDNNGRTAEDVAREIDLPVWQSWIGTKRLSP